jgi:hypothetical protein
VAGPEPRSLLHTRKITYKCWRRIDGLWDIEGELFDSKAYPWETPERGMLPPGEPVHHMRVRVGIDLQMRIHDASVEMPGTPFPECLSARSPIQLLIGANLGAGWIKAVEGAMGGVLGCTHLRELLYGIGTAAYQGLVDDRKLSEHGRPRHLDQCISWDVRGPVAKRITPEFAQLEAAKKD